MYDRLTTVELRLKSLTPETAATLVDMYLYHAKVGEQTPELFTPDLIKHMVEKTEGNLRSFIKLANKVVETLADDRELNNPASEAILNHITF